MRLEDMSKRELEELEADKKRDLVGIINLCKELGNKDIENNIMVKGLLEKINEIRNIIELKEYEEYE